MSAITYYHAGPRGLAEILPPTISGAPSCAAYGADGVCRRDRVYITTSLQAAIGFASLVPPHGAGVVYVVDPVNPQADPDCSEPGLSFEAERATIIRVIRPDGKTLKRARKIMVAA